LFNPSQEDVRNFFFGTWRKYQAREPLTPLEALAVEAIGRHPEYHEILDNPERYRERTYAPEQGETNPFLHLSLHLSIAEQLSINQPPGIKAEYERLCARLGDAHDAQHALLECLGEMIWQAQRHNTPYDPAIYFDCLRKR
jgi:hypothetical protein